MKIRFKNDCWILYSSNKIDFAGGHEAVTAVKFKKHYEFQIESIETKKGVVDITVSSSKNIIDGGEIIKLINVPKYFYEEVK